jgi:hypothetical protein
MRPPQQPQQKQQQQRLLHMHTFQTQNDKESLCMYPQVFQEETEFQQGIDDVRGRRRAAGSVGASQQPSQAAMIAQQEQQAAQQLKDAALLYARCLQHLLKVGSASSWHMSMQCYTCRAA